MRWTAVWMPAGKIPGVFSLCPRHHRRIFIQTEDNKRWWDVIHHNRNSIKGTVRTHGGVIGPHSAFKLHVIHMWMCNIKLVIDTSALRTWKIQIQVYVKCKETNRRLFCRLLTVVKYYTAEKWWKMIWIKMQKVCDFEYLCFICITRISCYLKWLIFDWQVLFQYFETAKTCVLWVYRLCQTFSRLSCYLSSQYCQQIFPLDLL